jgi:hypothetical protein
MKIVYLLLLFSLFSSCYDDINVNSKKTDFIISYKDPPLQIIILDSCEYFYLNTATTKLLTHKGNCSNCIKNK